MTQNINTSFNTYTTPTNTVTKVNGRQQTVMSANFADMLNANMATSTKPTTATTSTDKVTLSSQATQTAQDDIEVEAQKLAKQAMDDPRWKEGLTLLSFGDSNNMTPNNQKLLSSLQKEYSSIFGNPVAMSQPRFKALQGMIETLGSFPDKQDFTEDTLRHQSQIFKRYWEIVETAKAQEEGRSADFSWSNRYA